MKGRRAVASFPQPRQGMSRRRTTRAGRVRGLHARRIVARPRRHTWHGGAAGALEPSGHVVSAPSRSFGASAGGSRVALSFLGGGEISCVPRQRADFVPSLRDRRCRSGRDLRSRERVHLAVPTGESDLRDPAERPALQRVGRPPHARRTVRERRSPLHQWGHLDRGRGALLALAGNARPAFQNPGSNASNYAVGGARAVADYPCRFNLPAQVSAYLADFPAGPIGPSWRSRSAATMCGMRSSRLLCWAKIRRHTFNTRSAA